MATYTSAEAGAISMHGASRSSSGSLRTTARRWVIVALVLLAAPGLLPKAAAAVTPQPASGAAQVCTDSPLSIAFEAAPTLGTSGTVKVFRNDGALVDTIDLADPASLRRTVGNAVSDTGLLHLWR